MRFALSILLAFILSCVATIAWKLWPELTRPRKIDLAFQLPSSLELASIPTAARFDFPLGSENGAMSYNAQRFTENHHLGDDLNGIGGEDSDLGDPIYAVADGRALLARDGGPGWGNVIIVLHAYLENGGREYVQSVLWPCRNDARAGRRRSEARSANCDRRNSRWPLFCPSPFRNARIRHSVRWPGLSRKYTRMA